MVQALQVTGICMGIVFGTLIIIMLIIELFKVIFANKKEEFIKQEKVKKAVLNEKRIQELTADEEKVIAMVAAIEASNNQDNVKVRVVSCKQVG